MAFPQEKICTIEDIYALPDGERAELIDGRFYSMVPPNRIHQKISHVLEWAIENYIRRNSGSPPSAFMEIYASISAAFCNENSRSRRKKPNNRIPK